MGDQGARRRSRACLVSGSVSRRPAARRRRHRANAHRSHAATARSSTAPPRSRVTLRRASLRRHHDERARAAVATRMQLRADGTSVVGPKVARGRRAWRRSPFVGREAISPRSSAYEDARRTRLRSSSPSAVLPASARATSSRGVSRIVASFVARVALVSRGVVREESRARHHGRRRARDRRRREGRGPRGAMSATDVLLAKIDVVGRARESSSARLVANEPLPRASTPARRDALWMALTDMAMRGIPGGAARHRGRRRQWADSSRSPGSTLARSRGGASVFRPRDRTPHAVGDDPARFSGGINVRIEPPALARRTVRAIAKAILARRPTAPTARRWSNRSPRRPAGHALRRDCHASRTRDATRRALRPSRPPSRSRSTR